MAINPNPLILEKIQNQELDKRHFWTEIQYKLEKSNFQAASYMSKKSRLSVGNVDLVLIFLPEMLQSRPFN